MNAFDWLDNQLIIQSEQFELLCSDFGIEEVCLTVPLRIENTLTNPKECGASISLRFGFSHKTAGKMLTCSLHLQSEGGKHFGNKMELRWIMTTHENKPFSLGHVD